MPKVSDLGERGLLRKLRKTYPQMRLIGDDCAVLEELRTPLVTTDSFFEFTHFHRWWTDGVVLGRRLLEAALSDIAAMGGKPVCAFAAVVLPPDLEAHWLIDLYQGLTLRPDCPVAGGETIRGDTFGITLTVVGEGGDRCSILRRDALNPGDRLWVSGRIGRTLDAPELLEACGGLKGEGLQPVRKVLNPSQLDQVRWFLQPRAELELGARVRELGVRCGIDISDGLISEAAHLAEESGVDAVVELRRELFLESIACRPLEASTAGEDYLLLLGADCDLDLSTEGCIQAGYAIAGNGEVRVLLDGEELDAENTGYDHLKG